MLANRSFCAVAVCGLALCAAACGQGAGHATVIDPAHLPKVAQVSERFQSYNVEMVEVTGGRFWKPYDQVAASLAARESGTNQPTGLDPNLFQYRPPINLASVRLRNLAAGLAPSYVRVSGTWQNTTYFHDSDTPAPATPPKGFNGILTRQQWKGVVDFSNAVDAPIITSVAVSAGTRDADGAWTGTQAEQFFRYTKSVGGKIAATEFMNEPSIPQAGGVPPGYDGAAFARDIAAFTPVLRKMLPGTIYLGPGSVLEGISFVSGLKVLPSEDMLKATGPAFDAFSYHFYGGVSLRCAAGPTSGGVTAAMALSAEWLDRTDRVESFYGNLRNKYLPGKAMWLTETGETACGGDPWASTFLDSFRYLNQLGTLAKHGVQVVAHNTLAASDYALLDPSTLDPRPNYWAALLWRRVMGTTVLDAGNSNSPNLYLYAQCLRGSKSGVALLAINANTDGMQTLNLPVKSKRLTLTADRIESKQVLLNGKPLALLPGDALPATDGVAVPAGMLTLAPKSITFFAIDDAKNASCR